MKYSESEIRQYVAEEDVKFLRMTFFDLTGNQKNMSILPDALDRAFSAGIAFDASAIPGFGDELRSDLFLQPDTSTLCLLPWRPDHGRVARLFCRILHSDGTPFEGDCRALLQKAVDDAAAMGVSFAFGSEMEFYLFRRDENGEPTTIPYDRAGYMDIAPEDKGENVRREVCLMLEQMGIQPESSHHEEGPGQNEIDFRYSDPVSAADNTLTFRAAVKTVAAGYGLAADFSPKPLTGKPGSGMHINFSVKSASGGDCMPHVIAGVMDKIAGITLFMNPVDASYLRLGGAKAPGYITWSSENRSQLIRIPAATGEFKRAELRSPDPLANPYIAFALLIRAGLYGVDKLLPLPESTDVNLYTVPGELAEKLTRLPGSLSQAQKLARASDFVAECLPGGIVDFFCR